MGLAQRSEGKLRSTFAESSFLSALFACCLQLRHEGEQGAYHAWPNVRWRCPSAGSSCALGRAMGKPAAAQLTGSPTASGDANCVGANEIFRALRLRCVGAAPGLPGERVWCHSSHPSSLPHALPRRVGRERSLFGSFR